MSPAASGGSASAAAKPISKFGLPVIDARDFLATTDWSDAEDYRADDVGIETEDGTRLVHEGEILEYLKRTRERS